MLRGRWAGERWAVVNSAKEELATREVIWEDNLFYVNVKVLPPSFAIVNFSLKESSSNCIVYSTRNSPIFASSLMCNIFMAVSHSDLNIFSASIFAKELYCHVQLLGFAQGPTHYRKVGCGNWVGGTFCWALLLQEEKGTTRFKVFYSCWTRVSPVYVW